MTSANELQQALPAIGSEPPHLIVVDIGSPGGSGRPSNFFLLLIAVHGGEEEVLGLLGGAKGDYRPAITPLSKLVESVQNLATRGRSEPPQLVRSGPPQTRLTPHETRLLKLLVEGHSYKSAAAALGVTEHTVDFHLRSVYGKLQAHSKSDAVSKALRQGLVR